MSQGEHLRCEVAVIGSGLAGSILARILAAARCGDGRPRRVVLVERAAHPRFAIGESSTPLAAIALERMAERYALADLRDFAAYGRWSAAHPQLRRGLKRGFSFYSHRCGERYGNSPANEARLLVAASPNDQVADAHWLRQDVDAELAARAQAAGVIFRDRTLLESYREGAAGVVLRGERLGQRVIIEADFVVDASGRGGFLAGCLPLASVVDRVPVASALLAGHFERVASFAETAVEGGARLATGPYPDDLAAGHHLLEEGWMYQLPFDHGVMSAGFLLRSEKGEASGEVRSEKGEGAGEVEALRSEKLSEKGEASGEVVDQEALGALWKRLCGRYPTLQRQFRKARAVVPLLYSRRIQYRLERAAPVAGQGRWLLLPGAFAFADPLFSTGIAWSLVAVERVASMLVGLAPGQTPPATALARYGDLLSQEADWIESLIAAAYRAMDLQGGRGNLRPFAALAQFYFAAASYQEVSQRLKPEQCDWPWEGFLGCGEERLRSILAEAGRRLCDWDVANWDHHADEFERWIGEAIEPWNIAGLADPRRHNLYPVDFASLVAGAAKLGLSEAQVRAVLPRLGAIG